MECPVDDIVMPKWLPVEPLLEWLSTVGPLPKDVSCCMSALRRQKRVRWERVDEILMATHGPHMRQLYPDL